jgi:hypothetical protein
LLSSTIIYNLNSQQSSMSLSFSLYTINSFLLVVYSHRKKMIPKTWTFNIITFDNHWNCNFDWTKKNDLFNGKNGILYFTQTVIITTLMYGDWGFFLPKNINLKLIWTMSWFISPLPGNLVKIIFQLWPCICWKVLFGLSDMFSVQFISQA